MKIRPIYFIAGGLALALWVSVCDGRRIYDKASVAAGKYQEALVQAKTMNAEKDRVIAQGNEIIAVREKLISDSINEITIINTAIGAKDAKISLLQSRLRALEAADDLSGQVANLKEQIQAWSEKFSLAESVIAEKNAIIVDWATKFNAQMQISDAWKAKYDSETHLCFLAETGWKLADSKLRRTRIFGNIKTGLIVGALGYFGINAITGK